MFNRNVVPCIFLAIFLVAFCGCGKKTDVSHPPTNPVSYTLPNYTDANFAKGICLHAPAFLVLGPITAQAKNDFAVGRIATFSDGTVRKIVKIEENNGTLIVFVDDALPVGNVVGYPNKVNITDAVK